jgi:hypothetical protein
MKAQEAWEVLRTCRIFTSQVARRCSCQFWHQDRILFSFLFSSQRTEVPSRAKMDFTFRIIKIDDEILIRITPLTPCRHSLLTLERVRQCHAPTLHNYSLRVGSFPDFILLQCPPWRQKDTAPLPATGKKTSSLQAGKKILPGYDLENKQE